MANLTLFEKLDQIESRYEEMTQQLSSPEVLADSARYQKLAKTHADLAAMVAKYREWKEIEKGLQGAQAVAGRSRRRRDEADGADEEQRSKRATKSSSAN